MSISRNKIHYNAMRARRDAGFWSWLQSSSRVPSSAKRAVCGLRPTPSHFVDGKRHLPGNCSGARRRKTESVLFGGRARLIDLVEHAAIREVGWLRLRPSAELLIDR